MHLISAVVSKEWCLQENISEIFFIIHIDGVSFFNNSSIQVWPIVLKVGHRDYDSKPATIALYYGGSKPHSSNEYLRDLVEEANDYILNGLIPYEVKYSFGIFCIVADSPARAFIKV